ncbi:MAG: hypothetical protein WC428_02600 [Candidatus Paceibacterota bacterium]
MRYTDYEKEKTEKELSTAVGKILDGIDEYSNAANIQIKDNDFRDIYKLELNEMRVKLHNLQLELLKFKEKHLL